MASTRISAPMRGVGSQICRLSTRQPALATYPAICIATRQARSITTSIPSRASISSVTTSTAEHVPIKPFSEQTVLATIHQFPSLEPLRFEPYPANHLNLPTRRDILHRAVVYEGDMTRLGTASTKNRYEVRGSARKIRPQKGSGRARLGDKNSPMLRGGGVAHGPRPRSFATELPKKVYDLAWRTALSYRFRKGELIIVDNAMEIESPSMRLLNDILKHQEKLRGRGGSLMVTLEERPLLKEALKQMDREQQAQTWREVDVKGLLELSRIIIERDALHNILLTHEEDLTHVSIQPWHKSLIRSSTSDLEETIGWAQFRDLQLLDSKAQKEARPAAFEECASQRYALAQALPAGLRRNELSQSAYQMLADSKKLHFEQLTGLNFDEYAANAQETGEGNYEISPRWQILQVQRDQKANQASEASQVAPLESEEIELEVSEIELQQLELAREASVLAAQVYEHLKVAQELSGDAEGALTSEEYASNERTAVDYQKQTILDKKIRLAESKAHIARAKGDKVAYDKAVKEGDRLKMAREREQQALLADVEQEDAVAEELVVEEPIVKDTKQQEVEGKK